MITTVYRLSDVVQLPTHWAYCEAWEKIEHVNLTGVETCEVITEIVDNRAKGAQVWDDLESAVDAIKGNPGVDGDYADYGLLLAIETEGTVDGGYWNAVTKSTVKSVKSIAVDHLPIDGKLSEIQDAIDKFAVQETVDYYDSLPCPF